MACPEKDSVDPRYLFHDGFEASTNDLAELFLQDESRWANIQLVHPERTSYCIIHFGHEKIQLMYRSSDKILYICTIQLLQYINSLMIDFILDPKAGVPFYRQIIDQIKYGIATGKLRVGEQLPTVRALAVHLKVNLNTIAKAYKELEIQNILETHQGTGTFISQLDVQLSEKEKNKKLEDICNEFLTIAHSYGFSVEDLITQLQKQQ